MNTSLQSAKKNQHTKICAIVNVTPDSFSDGNQWFETESAISHGLELVNQGADFLDIGGESTRPGSQLISSTQEIKRVEPVITGLLNKTSIPLSIDTWKADVAEHCLNHGVKIINDISGFFGDPQMVDLIAGHTAKPSFVLMFNAAIARPQHKSSQSFPKFSRKNSAKPFSVFEYEQMSNMEILDLMKFYFEKALNLAVNSGVEQNRIFLDPGIGFALTEKENLILIKNLSLIHQMGFKAFLGVSRKRFLVNILKKNFIETNSKTEQGFVNRDHASTALTAIAASHGVEVIRTHTVKEHLIAARIGEAVYQANFAEDTDLPQYSN